MTLIDLEDLTEEQYNSMVKQWKINDYLTDIKILIHSKFFNIKTKEEIQEYINIQTPLFNNFEHYKDIDHLTDELVEMKKVLLTKDKEHLIKVINTFLHREKEDNRSNEEYVEVIIEGLLQFIHCIMTSPECKYDTERIISKFHKIINLELPDEYL